MAKGRHEKKNWCQKVFCNVSYVETERKNATIYDFLAETERTTFAVLFESSWIFSFRANAVYVFTCEMLLHFGIGFVVAALP